VLPKSERLRKIKANKGMLLLPPEHSAPGSLEECHGVIAMTVLSARGYKVGCRCGEYPPWVAGTKNGPSHTGIVSQQPGGGYFCSY